MLTYFVVRMSGFGIVCQKSSLHEEIGGIGFRSTTEPPWGHAANRINHSFKRSSAVAISKPLRFRFSFYSGDQFQGQVTQREVFRRLSAAHFVRFDAVTECGHHEWEGLGHNRLGLCCVSVKDVHYVCVYIYIHLSDNVIFGFVSMNGEMGP